MRFSSRGLRRGLTVAALAAVVSPLLSLPATAQPGGTVHGADSPDAVPGRYIVTFKDGTSAPDTAAALVRRHGGGLRHTFGAVIQGFSASLTEAQARAVAANPAVARVQQAQYVRALDTQTNPPNWGVDRIDQRALPLDGSFTYPANPGRGVRVYVLDSGINAGHAEFTGRVAPGRDLVDNDSSPTDCHGHGTHVAGTAVGARFGVAKKATVSAVRVLDCRGNGADDDIIAGIEWVRANAVKPAVVNYSIGCRSRCSSPAIDTAVKNLVGSGVQFVQAAGNSGDDACHYSPQYVTAAITVGNSTRNDQRHSGTGPSNYGSCLDIWAPGTGIVSASYSSSTGAATMTGTSMASPHVAGAAALYLSRYPSATPAQVRNALVDNSSTGRLTGIGSTSPNALLNTGFLN
ncbi:S8 family peptidase [Saccharothrix xinjiangensis]|uniref:S8 family peptidase n=1 Tax=Saccharothrix xinjiangensis TaxID=204798 RepID=A0ABV9XV86_9PSEU